MSHGHQHDNKNRMVAQLKNKEAAAAHQAADEDQIEGRRRLIVLIQHRRNDRPPCKRPARERLLRILRIYELDVHTVDTSGFVCALCVEGSLEGCVSRRKFRLVFLDWPGDTKILDGAVSKTLL